MSLLRPGHSLARSLLPLESLRFSKLLLPPLLPLPLGLPEPDAEGDDPEATTTAACPLLFPAFLLLGFFSSPDASASLTSSRQARMRASLCF